MDGALRVRLVDDDGASHILLPWEVLAGDSWRQRTADIAAFAGQTVTLFFEQGDNDVGNGEHRYVDNVILCEGATPSPTPGECCDRELCATAPRRSNLPPILYR